MKKLLSLACVLIAGCASSQALRPPTFQKAYRLRGQSFEEVSKTLGAPADHPQADHAVWFLSEDGENHPAPTPVAFDFFFKNSQLIKIEKAVK